ncbi:MAG: hypothetical protein Q7R76_00950 [Candidatus Woesearchaeota archaeon]|nr:hypothetical protein [Candidatus Woesearchaeota archaeon]
MIDAFASLQYELSKVKDDINSEVQLLKEECEDHLDAINQNTEEIGEVQTSVAVVEEKIEKLNARIDNIHMMFNQLLWQTKISIELDTNEQILFQLLCGYNDFVTDTFVTEKTQLNETIMRETITSLIDKGIPVVMKAVGGRVFLRLDAEFRKLQRKNKMVKVNAAVCRRFDNRPLEAFVKKEIMQ